MVEDRASWRLHTARRMVDLPATLFDGTAPASAYTHRAELRSLEGRSYNTVYLTVTDGAGATVAFVPVYRIDRPPTDGYDPGVLFGLPATGELMLFGSVRSFVSHLTFAESLSTRHRGEATDLLLRAALELADQHAVEVVLAPCLDAVQAAAVDLALPGRPRHAEPRAVVDIGWDDFEGYRASLTNRKARQTVRKERVAFEPLRAGLVDRPFTTALPDVLPLLLQVEHKHGSPLTATQVEWYLRMISRPMGEQGRALVLSVDDRPIAVTTVWQHPREWHVRAWGCDYDRAGDLPLYANMVYYEPIERAIHAGVPVVHFGGQALDAKRRRGARTEDLVSILLTGRQG